MEYEYPPSFLPRDTMLAQFMLTLCVRPPIASWSSTKMVKPRITQTAPYDIPGTVVYC